MAKRKTNGLPLLVCLSEVLFVVAASEQCQVKDIHVKSDEANSTFVYNFIYKDPSCLNKDKSGMILKSCDGVSDTISYKPKAEGITNICTEEGRWKVTVGRIESDCFNCSFGTFRNPRITFRFTYKELFIKMQSVHPRVSGWNVAIYKATKAYDYLVCDLYNADTMKKQFQKTSLQPTIIKGNNGSEWKITLDQTFDDGCYCFEIVPISYMSLSPPNEVFSTKDCKPGAIASENGRISIHDMSTSTKTWTTLSVLVGIVILAVLVLYVILSKHQFLSKLLGLKQIIVGQRRLSNEQMISRDPGVLLLYAPDISGSKHLAELKTHLHNNFKMHDLFDRNDYKQLADPCGWVQKMLLPGSGVKLLLVESEGMTNFIKSLLQPSSESLGIVKAEHTECGLLTFVLRTIICTDLRGDYSTVFVVRFFDEMEEVVDLMVHMKRYKFPDHILKLKEAMMEASCSSDGDDVV